MLAELNERTGRWENPKPTPPKQKTAEQIAADENSRLAQRAKIREAIAASELAEQQRLEIVAAIEAVNAKKERLASDHVETAAPLQARLKEIESAQISAIKNRQPADPELEAERAGLLDQVRQLNVILKQAIDREDALLETLENERVECAKKCGTNLLETELFQLGRRDLLVACHVKRSAARWAEARLKAAQTNETSLNITFVQAELADAQAAFARASAEAQQAYLAVINE